MIQRLPLLALAATVCASCGSSPKDPEWTSVSARFVGAYEDVEDCPSTKTVRYSRVDFSQFSNEDAIRKKTSARNVKCVYSADLGASPNRDCDYDLAWFDYVQVENNLDLVASLKVEDRFWIKRSGCFYEFSIK